MEIDNMELRAKAMQETEAVHKQQAEMESRLPPNTVNFSTLPHIKASQLNLAISIPPMYITVEGYRYDESLKATLYKIEIGIQKGSMVYQHVIERRFSAFQEFDNQIRPKFNESRYLLPFPPKKLFGNTDPVFVEKRAKKLQDYLGNLVRVAGVCETSSFRQTFGITDTMIEIH